MRRILDPFGIAATFCMAMALMCSHAVYAQEPPKDYVAFKAVAKVKYDAAVSYTIPGVQPRVDVSRFVGPGDGSPIGAFTLTEVDREYYGVDGVYLFYEATGVLAAVNGDVLIYKGVGLGDPDKAGFIITGGSGRFRGATGSGFYTYKALNADETEFENTYDGFVSVPK